MQNPNPVVAAGQRSSSTSQPKAPKRQKADTTMYEVACIVDEVLGSKTQQPRYRVQWAATGYTQEWEEYRDSGQVGGAIQTWEPLDHVRHTEAFRDWEAAKAANPAIQEA